MKTKNLSTKSLADRLSSVVCRLEADERFNCDFLVSICSCSVTLCNWKHKMIPQVCLRSISQICVSNGLMFYIDLDDSKLIIHG